MLVRLPSCTPRPPRPVLPLPTIPNRIGPPPEPCPRASPHCCTPFASCSASAAISPRPRRTAPPAPTSTPSRPASAPGGCMRSSPTCNAASCVPSRWSGCCSRARHAAGISASPHRASARPRHRPHRPRDPAGPPSQRRRTTGRGTRRAEARGAAVPPARLERSRTVHADPGGTRGAGAPPPARPHPGRYLPRPGGGARLLHRSVLERAVRQHPLAWRQRRHADAGEDPPGGGVRQGAGPEAGEQLGLAGDGTGGAPPRAGVLHRRGGGRSVRSGHRNHTRRPRRWPPGRPDPVAHIEAQRAHGTGSWPAPAFRFGPTQRTAEPGGACAGTEYSKASNIRPPKG